MLGRILKNLFRRGEQTFGSSSGRPFFRALQLYQDGLLDDAERACRNLEGAPQPDVDFLRGLIAQARGDHDTAVAAFEQAIASRDSEAAFHFSLAESLIELGRHDGASPHAERFLKLAQPGDPRRVRAWMMLFACRMQCGDVSGADAFAQKAIDSEPQNPALLSWVSDGFLLESRVEEARAVADRRLALADSFSVRIRRVAMLPQIYDSREHIQQVRRRFSAEMDVLLSHPVTPAPAHPSEMGILPFYLAYHNANNVALLRKFCTVVRRAFRANNDLPTRPRPAGKIRVGFLSTYFYRHSVGRTTFGLIRDMPRQRFAVHVFAIGPKDDPMRRAIEAAADHYHQLPNDVQRAHTAIAQANLDVLVFADIGMHPTTYFLALSRLAPLQVATWGHSETSGIDTVDYYLSADGVEGEAAQDHYSETLLRPKAFFLPGYQRPQISPRASSDSSVLPSECRYYACLQAQFKLHPDMDDVFKAILERDVQGEIVLLDSRPSWSALLRRRLRRSLGEAVQRVRFLPSMRHDRFLATLSASAVLLDPLYFGGCNSSCEAMALGVPVVTLPGGYLHGRFTAALYSELGIEDCVVHTIDDYADRAVRLACDRDYRAAISSNILQRSDQLFDRKDLTLEFARFLEEKLAVVQ
jgi:protein O-GlcNAc transferase